MGKNFGFSSKPKVGLGGRWIDHLIQWVLLLMIPFGVIGETVVVMCILLLYKWKNVTATLIFAIILLIHLLPGIFFYDYPHAKGIQQVILVTVYFLGYSTFYRSCVRGTEEIWKKYTQACQIFAVLAFVQLFIFTATGYDPFLIGRSVSRLSGGIRLHAYFAEPGVYATFLTPYVAYTILCWKSIKDTEKWDVIVVCSYLLTMTSISYTLFILALLYRLLMSKYRVPSLMLIVIPLVYVASLTVRQYASYSIQRGLFGQAVAKISETGTALQRLTPRTFENYNLSTYATTSNLWIATKAPMRLWGTGIGTHPVNYERIYRSSIIGYGQNKEDAYSLFIRVFSEFGMAGIVMLVFFLFRYHNRSQMINVSILFYLVANLMRGGHYTFNGLFFFAFLYYMTSERRLLQQIESLKWKIRQYKRQYGTSLS